MGPAQYLVLKLKGVVKFTVQRTWTIFGIKEGGPFS